MSVLFSAALVSAVFWFFFEENIVVGCSLFSRFCHWWLFYRLTVGMAKCKTDLAWLLFVLETEGSNILLLYFSDGRSKRCCTTVS